MAMEYQELLCSHCGCAGTLYEVIDDEVDDRRYCKDCLDDVYPECQVCDERSHEDDIHIIYFGETKLTACNHCFLNLKDEISRKTNSW